MQRLILFLFLFLFSIVNIFFFIISYFCFFLNFLSYSFFLVYFCLIFLSSAVLLRYSSFCFVCKVKTIIQEDIYVTFSKFEIYSKEPAIKTLIQQNARNYSEIVPYTDHSWEEDSSSQLEEFLNQFIKMT